MSDTFHHAAAGRPVRLSGRKIGRRIGYAFECCCGQRGRKFAKRLASRAARRFTRDDCSAI